LPPSFIKYFFLILFTASFTKVKAQLDAAFSASVTSGCAALKVNFSDASTGSPAQWFWDFGDGQTSNLKDPSVTYILPGIYTVRLIVKNTTEQAYEEKTNYITVLPTPQPVFITDVTSGCLPLNVSFTDQTNTTGLNIAGRLWSFGDGATSSLQNPVHTYTTAGSFDVSLTIQTVEGCSSTILQPGIITTGNKPVADFSASALDGCASLTRDFTIQSSSIFTSALWNFGDGSFSSEISPTHHFLDTGWLNVGLIVSDNGCADTVVKLNYIHVQGPAAKINKTVDCNNRLDLTFKDGSIGETKTRWNFGDGTTSTLKTITHTYTAPGQYNVKLNVSNATCNDTTNLVIYIPSVTPTVDYSPKLPFYCKGDSIQFLYSDYDKGSGAVFAWKFGNGDSLNYSSTNDTIYYVYRTNGNFTPTAFLKDQERCIDTLSFNSLTIKGPTAAFTSATPACTNSATNFTDKSTIDDAPITTWQWSYGDGTIATDTIPFGYNYAFPGKYNVNLQVTDSNNCINNVTNAIVINETPVVIAQTDKLLCLGQTDTLTATGADIYNWSTDGGVICNSCTNPIVSPNTSETYYVTGTNSSGCFATDTTSITVQAKQTVSVQPANIAICSGSATQLSAGGTDLYSWLPTDNLSNADIKDPMASPTTNTVYTVIGEDSNSCFTDTATVNVVVNPLPSVNIPVDNITLPSGSTYQLQAISSSDVIGYQWNPSTGLSCYNCPNPIATVNKTSIYTVTVYNSNGCSSKDSIRLSTVCNSDFVFIPNTFSPNNDGMNDYFFPNSKPSINVRAMHIYNRWGEKVFEKMNFLTNSYSNGWNGKYANKDQASDVYIYVIELQCADGNKIVMKGNVSLLR